MKRIKEIKIKNFKAFQEEQSFDIKGKNILVYGNNGSGKSSLFWALYTLLQSSTKSDDSVRKYFKKYIPSDTSTHQTLKNIFIDNLENSYIKLTSIDKETGKEDTYTISHDIINTNNNDDTIIQELNLASDFINYKLLHNFYRASHKQETNLWPVFEHDIFPFLTEGTQNWLEDIIMGRTTDVPRTPKGAVVSRDKKERFIQEIKALNDKIQNLLTEIQINANTFIKNHFFEGKEVIRIAIDFNKKFKFDNVRYDLWGDKQEGYRHDQLHIKLSVEVKEEKPIPHWNKIERVQSFLNEAQLTRIAISIRIGALMTRPLAEAKFKILVLDDMLISLDLSNRMDVVRIFLNKENKPELKFFNDFQKIILTHDKGFFNLIRRNTDEEEWVYYNFAKDESNNSAPKVKEDLTSLQKAVKNFQEEEFENCGNELRKEAEAILTSFLDPKMKKMNKEFKSLNEKLETAFNVISKQRFQKFNQVFIPDIEISKLRKIKTNYQLDPDFEEYDRIKLDNLKNRLFDFLLEFNEQRNRKELLIKDTKEILDRVMNAASHHTENPLYSTELKQAIEGIKNLKENINT
ncbi:MAG: AAA family ATPase [Bacteroidetes bacterium]|nr:AAA family ATPase [Bacteroidota bacterium]